MSDFAHHQGEFMSDELDSRTTDAVLRVGISKELAAAKGDPLLLHAAEQAEIAVLRLAAELYGVPWPELA
jgi:hypothetical protein